MEDPNHIYGIGYAKGNSVNARNRINLIPRNNWDYNFNALVTALVGINRPTCQASNVEKVFSQATIFTNTGRTSLFAILKALGLPPGAKVGVPLFCCSVVFNAIYQAGLSPCFIDSNLIDCNISAENLREKQSSLDAVIAVHMFGNPCDMDAILDAAGHLPVIEDCAQSIFSTYKGTITGLLSSASFFSFRCGKYISAGEGSVILCKVPELRNKIEGIVNSFPIWSKRKMLTHALVTFAKATLYNRPWYGLIGYPVGMRLDKKYNLTAKGGFSTEKVASTHIAMIEDRIPHFLEKIERQRAHAQLLLNSLVPNNYHLPSETDGCFSNWFQFPLRFDNPHHRDRMAAYLFKQGIDTAKYLDDIVSEACTQYGYGGNCPNAELLSKTILLIPIHYSLRLTDIEHIALSINKTSQLV